ncbi:hypothetical protein BKD30_00980 [Tersicoccus phoenicis]|uniref:AMIN-like domain-containing protein n=1 Tax=Tersicoccus phoenicis TaxID=554083 RepID=A0A1R1LP93_9MICC|nr:hypothetical protein [Tersicoccus phoenicis]OMH29294.1 hypothetical protein BKD30_00980 [Tersicoccus phoenicis]
MKTLRTAVATLALAGSLLVAPSTATAATTTAGPWCGITWGSTPKADQRMTVATLTGVRAGQHPCYDRLVFDVRGSTVGYSVRYVTTVYREGVGTPLPLRGGASLEVIIRAAGTSAALNRSEMVPVAGYQTLRQVAWGGSFEGQSTVGVGVRARLPMRAFVLRDGATSRLVVDIAHRW